MVRKVGDLCRVGANDSVAEVFGGNEEVSLHVSIIGYPAAELNPSGQKKSPRRSGGFSDRTLRRVPKPLPNPC